MISDDDLYRLAVFLGTAAMMLIVFYHFVEVNSDEKVAAAEKAALKAHTPTLAAGKGATK